MRRGGRALLAVAGVALAVALVAAAEFALRLARADELALLRRVTRDGEAWLERRDPAWQLPVAAGDPLDRVACRVAKPAGVARVVVVGESTAAGFPFAPKLSFGRLLEAALRCGSGGGSGGGAVGAVEVVNLARAGDSSDDVRAVAIEALALSPEVVVVCSGHNEFQGSCLSDLRDGLWPRLRARLRRLALVRVGSERITSRAAAAELAPPTSDVADRPFLSASERARGADRFRANLAAIAAATENAGAALIVMTQVADLSDPPNASSFRAALADVGRATYRRVLAEVEQSVATGAPAPAGAIARLRDLDPDVACFQFACGRLAERDGDPVAARAAYERALELDDAPDRVGAALNGVVRELAADGRARLVDAQAAFAALPPASSPARDLFLDYCHPDVPGLALLAELVLPDVHAALAERGIALPPLAEARARLRRPLSLLLTELSLTRAALAEGSARAGRVLEEKAPARARDAFLLALRLAPESDDALAGIARCEPGATPAALAKARLDALARFVLARGLRPALGSDEWRDVATLLEEVAGRDDALRREPTWLALRAVARAGGGDGDGARRAFAELALAQPDAWRGIATPLRELPALAAALAAVGLAVDEKGGLVGLLPPEDR